VTIAVCGLHDIEVWSDGAVMDKRGAGAANAYDNDRNKMYSDVVPAGNLASSFKAESEAALIGSKRVVNTEDIVKKGTRLLLCTDSLSVVSALSKGPIQQKLDTMVAIMKNILTLVNEGEVEVVNVVFGEGHVGVDKNERVDALVGKHMRILEKEKTGASQKKAMVLAQAIKSTVLHQLSTANREGLRQSSHRYEICGDKFFDLKFSASLSRQREVWLSQLRVGKRMLMGSHRSSISSNNSPLCRWCGVVNETILLVTILVLYN
jgi:ribonuclease HI